MRRKFDSNDAVMAHQSACSRLAASGGPTLLEEYFAVCREYADSFEARTAHQRFLQHMDALRGMLVTQRPTQANSSQPSSQSRAPNSGSGGAPSGNPTSYPRTQFFIIPADWGKEMSKKLFFAWNSRNKELTLLSTELIVAWLLRNEAFEGYASLKPLSDTTCYASTLGLCFQKWPNIKDAKNFVNGLNVVLNAPLSRFAVPFAFAVEILGQAVVGMSVAPIDKPWHVWKQVPLCVFHVDALCASSRFFFSQFRSTVGTGSGGSTGASSSSQQKRPGSDDDDDNDDDDDDGNRASARRRRGGQAASSSSSSLAARHSTVHFIDHPGMELCVAVGADARWYIIDGRSIALRQPLARHTSLSLRLPRREALFTPTGALSTPYTPNELIFRFKLKMIAEQLLTDPSFVHGVTGLISGVMHQHGVRFGPFVYPLYLSICEQERQFRVSVQATNRRTAMTPAASAKLQRFLHVKSVIVSELVARCIKHLIREELYRVQCGKAFVSHLLAVVTDDGEDEHEAERRIARVNAQLLDAMNLILGGIFNAEGAVPSIIRGANAAGSLSAGGNAASPTSTAPAGGGLGALGIAPITSAFGDSGGTSSSTAAAAKGQRFSAVVLESLLLDDIIFMVNDRFVSRVYADDELQLECRYLGVPCLPRLEIALEDLDVPRILVTLETLLGVPLAVRAQKLQVDAAANVLEGFFNLDAREPNILRGDCFMMQLEVPLCLGSGSRNKVLDYVSLQQRVAAKLLSQIDLSSQQSDVLHYAAAVVKFVLLHAHDVNVAYRGYLQEEDYEEVWMVDQQVTCPPSPYGRKMSVALEAAVALRMAYLMSQTDLQVCLRRLMKFTDATRSLFDSPVGTAFVLADKIHVLCKICETFVASGLVAALETALTDLTSLTVDPHVIRYDARDEVLAAGSPQRLAALAAARKSARHAEIKSIHAAYLQLLPLSLLVRHVMLPDTRRTQGESLAAAVRYCTKRRDLIVEVYGEKSVEAGIACNDIAAICSNHKFDFDRAEEEFERAVFILNEVQPDGASLQVTKNNLAFLCFRKAERLRKQLSQDAQHKTRAARDQINSDVRNLLSKARMLLTEVLDQEQKLPVLDYAAALNNLASIKLFENQFEEAKQLFARTLEITSHLDSGAAGGGLGGAGDGSVGGELPCRIHAIRNLKVLARRQYLSAVMRVQAAIRRFVTRIRERKNFKMLRAIKPIQRLGRAYLTRMFLAKHYRFSAFHSWLRKPKVFVRKLEATYLTMPVEARRDAWEAKMTKASRLLQRAGRGFMLRWVVGKLVGFLRAHFEKRRPPLLQEITRRRRLQFSAEALRWKILFGCEHVVELCDMCAEGLRQEVRIVRSEVFGDEAWMRRVFFLRQEAERRKVTEKDWVRERAAAADVFEQQRLVIQWGASRQEETLSRMAMLEGECRDAVRFLETSARVVRLQRRDEHLQLFVLESLLRRRIAVQAFTKFLPPQTLKRIQSTAAAYLARKRCARLLFLPEREAELRLQIVEEERIALNREFLMKQFVFVQVMEQEERNRVALQSAAFAVYEKRFGRVRQTFTMEYLELGERAVWEHKEQTEFAALTTLFEREHMQLSHMLGYLWILAREAALRMHISDMAWAQQTAMLLSVYQSTTRELVRRDVALALAIAVRSEAMGRHSTEASEAVQRLVDVDEPFLRGSTRVLENRAAEHTRELELASRLDSLSSYKTRIRNHEQRVDLEAREASERTNVVRSLEEVARQYLLHDWQALLEKVFYFRSVRYSCQLLSEWFLFDFFPGAHDLIVRRCEHEHRVGLVALQQWEHRHRVATGSLVEIVRDERDGRRRIVLAWYAAKLEATALLEKLSQANAALTNRAYSLLYHVHTYASEECERQALVREAQEEAQSRYASGVLQFLHPRIVSVREDRERFVLQAQHLLATEAVSRRDIAAEWQWSVVLVCNTVIKPELLHRIEVERLEALGAAEWYLLERHGRLLAESLYPRLVGYFNKRHGELVSMNRARHVRLAVHLLQRVGRGCLRRKRFGRFHFEEVVTPLLLLQRVARGFACRRSRGSVLRFAGRRLRLEAEEQQRRDMVMEEASESGAQLLRLATQFTGSQFLRMRSAATLTSSSNGNETPEGGPFGAAAGVVDVGRPLSPPAAVRKVPTSPIGISHSHTPSRSPPLSSQQQQQALPQQQSPTTASPREPTEPRTTARTAPRSAAPHASPSPPSTAPPGGSSSSTSRGRSKWNQNTLPTATASPRPVPQPSSQQPPSASSQQPWRSRLFATPAWKSDALFASHRSRTNHPPASTVVEIEEGSEEELRRTTAAGMPSHEPPLSVPPPLTGIALPARSNSASAHGNSGSTILPFPAQPQQRTTTAASASLPATMAGILSAATTPQHNGFSRGDSMDDLGDFISSSSMNTNSGRKTSHSESLPRYEREASNSSGGAPFASSSPYRVEVAVAHPVAQSAPSLPLPPSSAATATKPRGTLAATHADASAHSGASTANTITRQSKAAVAALTKAAAERRNVESGTRHAFLADDELRQGRPPSTMNKRANGGSVGHPGFATTASIYGVPDVDPRPGTSTGGKPHQASRKDRGRR